MKDFTTGSADQMLAAFESKLADIQSSEFSGILNSTTLDDDLDTEVAISTKDASILYNDRDGMFGEPGEMISLADIKNYWNSESKYDPSLEHYQSFRDWWKDTEQWLKYVSGSETDSARMIDSSTAVKAARDDNYFGETAAFNYGNKIVDELGVGATVSKRKDLAEEPGGLIYVANELGIDMWELLEALEGMCADGRVTEIDDSTYQIVSTKRHPVRSLFYNEAEDRNSRWTNVTTASTIADNGQEVFQLMSYSSDPEAGIDGDDFYCYGEFFADDKADAERQLEEAKQKYPAFFVPGNPYSDIYVEEYNEYFATGDEIYQNLSAIVQNFNTPDSEADEELPFASTSIKANYTESSEQEYIKGQDSDYIDLLIESVDATLSEDSELFDWNWERSSEDEIINLVTIKDPDDPQIFEYTIPKQDLSGDIVKDTNYILDAVYPPNEESQRPEFMWED